MTTESLLSIHYPDEALRMVVTEGFSTRIVYRIVYRLEFERGRLVIYAQGSQVWESEPIVDTPEAAMKQAFHFLCKTHPHHYDLLGIYSRIRFRYTTLRGSHP